MVTEPDSIHNEENHHQEFHWVKGWRLERMSLTTPLKSPYLCIQMRISVSYPLSLSIHSLSYVLCLQISDLMKNKYTLKLRTIETPRERDLGERFWTLQCEVRQKVEERWEKSHCLFILFFSPPVPYSLSHDLKRRNFWQNEWLLTLNYMLQESLSSCGGESEENEVWRRRERKRKGRRPFLFFYFHLLNSKQSWSLSMNNLFLFFSLFPVFSLFFLTSFLFPFLIHPSILSLFLPFHLQLWISLLFLHAGNGMRRRKRIRASFCKEKRFTMAWKSSV